MMSNTFMPVNVTGPHVPAVPQLLLPPQQQFGGLTLQQSFQQYNQGLGGITAPKMPCALSKVEKKNHDQISKSWGARGTGFINDQTALDVFGQNGLDRNDLAKVW